MEGCPKIPMINFDLKLCNFDAGEFAEKILNYIHLHYQENPESYKRELTDFLMLRQAALDSSKDYMGCNLLKKYLRQLQFVAGRFPMKSGEECEAEISWDHLYNEKEIIHSDVRFELQCVLYNIGALHSYLGCLDKRSNDDGIKMSCTHFQQAAWAFQTIRDTYSPLGFTSDLNDDIMTFKFNVMLGQAQECVLEKSIIDSRKHTINAKVSAQIIDYYKIALANCEKSEFQSNLGSKQTKELKNYCQFKINYYTALVNYFMSLSSAEQNKYGEAIGFIQVSEAKLQECAKMKLKEYSETLKYATDVIDTKSKSLKKDNDFVYNEKIIASANLPEVKGVSLVKCMPIDLNSDPEIATPDIFSRLVSMKAHELSSLYSEEKAKLLRQVLSQVEEKNEQLQNFLAALQLKQLHLDNHDYLKLPKQLLECCASISVRPTLLKEEIPNVMKQIVSVSMKSKELLDDLEELLTKERDEYKQLKRQCGDLEESGESGESDDSDAENDKLRIQRRLGSLKLDKSYYLNRRAKLKEILNGYELLSRNYSDANSSNLALREAFENAMKKLEMLSLPLAELSERLPVVEEINNEESKQVKDRLVSLIAKVDEMKEQRDQLLKRFQRSIMDDDLTKVIASKQTEIGESGEEVGKLFADQLKKHEQLIGYLQQNLQAQDNILRALTEANALFALDRRKISEALQKRNTVIDGLVFAYQSVNDLFEKSRQGIQFFERVNESLSDLIKNFKDFYEKTRKERTIGAGPDRSRKPGGFSSQKGAAVPARNPQTLMNNLDDLNMVGDLSLEEINSIISQSSKGFGQPMPGGVPGGGMAGMPATGGSAFNPAGYKRPPGGPGPGQMPAMANDRPKLKDFLPFMKPNSWGKEPNAALGPVSAPQAQQAYPGAPDPLMAGHAMGSLQSNLVPNQNFAGFGQTPGFPAQTKPPVLPNVQSQTTGYPQQAFPGQVAPVQNHASALPPVNQSVNMNQAQAFRQPEMPMNPHLNGQSSLPNPAAQAQNQQNISMLQYQQQQQQQALQMQLNIQQQQVQQKVLEQQQQQQKEYEKKLLEQQLVEKELQLKKQQLEQQEKELQFKQQQMLFQQQQQQMLLQQQKQQQEQQFKSMQFAAASAMAVNPAMGPVLEPNTAPQVGPAPSALSAEKAPLPPLKPDSVYKPGMFDILSQLPPLQSTTNQLKDVVSPAKTDATLNAAQPKPGAQVSVTPNHPGYTTMHVGPVQPVPGTAQQPGVGVNPAYSAQIPPTQAPTPSNPYPNQLQNHGPAIQSVAQAPNPLPPGQTAAKPVVPAALPPPKPSSNIDDLFDLFDSKNLSSTASNGLTLNPTRIDILNPLKPASSVQPTPPASQPILPSQPVYDEKTVSAGVRPESNGFSAFNQSYVQQQSSTDSMRSEMTTPKPTLDLSLASSMTNQVISTPTMAKSSVATNGGGGGTPSVPQSPINLTMNNKQRMERFLNEVAKFENHVNSLTVKTLSKTTILEKEWKELNDHQEKQSGKMTISVARCYPNKNRYQDLLPYDQTRVCLKPTGYQKPSGGDDYVNATNVGQLNLELDAAATQQSPALFKSPNFIVSQAPITASLTEFYEFWLMVWQQQIELIVCLCSNSDVGLGESTESSHLFYLSEEKQKPLNLFSLKIQQQSMKKTANSIQRVCTITNTSDVNNQTKTVVILQYLLSSGQASAGSPTSAAPLNPIEMPENKASFLKFVKECESFYLTQQRNQSNPVLVHCTNGVSRSAVFVLLYSLVQIVDLVYNSGGQMHSSPSLMTSDYVIRLVKQMRSKRKYMIQSMNNLKYSYETILYYLKDLLIKEGFLTTTSSSATPSVVGSIGVAASPQTPATTASLIKSPSSASLSSIQSDRTRIINDESLAPIQSQFQSANAELANQIADLSGGNQLGHVGGSLSPEQSGAAKTVTAASSSPQQVSGANPVANISIIDLCDPSKFNLNLSDDSSKRKPKITKKDFFSPSTPGAGGQHQQDQLKNDPFLSLDPLRKSS